MYSINFKKMKKIIFLNKYYKTKRNMTLFFIKFKVINLRLWYLFYYCHKIKKFGPSPLNFKKMKSKKKHKKKITTKA